MTSRLRSVWSQRRAPMSLIAITATIVAFAPGQAGAATQIGQTFTPVEACGNSTFLQSTSPGGQYTTPFAGVITSWSFQAPASSVPSQLKLKVARPEGGDEFTIMGEEGPRAPIPSALNIFPARIPVQAGNVLGLWGATGYCTRDNLAYPTYHVGAGDQPPGSTDTYLEGVNLQVDVSATLEPDCDSDGFGDETQDPEFTDPDCPPPAPKADRTLTLDANKGKVEKGRKVRLTGQIDSPQNEAGCEPNQTVELQRKKTKAPDTAFTTFKTVQTDQAGNFADKVKVKKTRVYRAIVQESAACDEELSNTQKVRVQKKKAAQEA
jgi:hypothetical protein